MREHGWAPLQHGLSGLDCGTTIFVTLLTLWLGGGHHGTAADRARTRVAAAIPARTAQASFARDRQSRSSRIQDRATTPLHYAGRHPEQAEPASSFGSVVGWRSLKESEQQIPHRLKSVRDDKNKGAQLKLCPFRAAQNRLYQQRLKPPFQAGCSKARWDSGSFSALNSPGNPLPSRKCRRQEAREPKSCGWIRRAPWAGFRCPPMPSA